MKPQQALLLTLWCLLPISVQAQLSYQSRIYDGGMTISADRQDIRLSVFPSAQFFLSPNFSIGGHLQANGSFDQGLQLIMAEPEIRWHFNPAHPSTNWFAFSSGRVGVYSNNENIRIPFELRSGIGLLQHLGGGSVWESKLFALFRRQGGNQFLEHPTFTFQNRLVFHRVSAGEQDSGPVVPVSQKGALMIGGTTFTANFTQTFIADAIDVNLSPSVGYFLSDHVLVGMQLSFGYGSIWSTPTTIDKFRVTTLNWGFTPFTRWYPGNPLSHMRPFAAVRMQWSYGQSNAHPSGPANFPVKTHFYNQVVQVGGGVDIFVAEQVALEIGLFLGRSAPNERTYGNFSMGFQYFLAGQE